jgi:CBS domain-containing protein
METATVRDVMSTDIVAVRTDLSVRDLAALLAEKQITGAPVVDRDGRLVGVVSVTDIAEAERQDDDICGDASDPGRALRSFQDRADADDLRALHVEREPLLVRDVMTPAVYAVPEQTEASAAARAMIAGRIHRLFVTRAGRVIGIVTSLDLLKLLCGGAR